MEHPQAEELQRISDILEKNPIISEMVWQDLTRDVRNRGAGAHGMSAEQVLRAAIVDTPFSHLEEPGIAPVARRRNIMRASK